MKKSAMFLDLLFKKAQAQSEKKPKVVVQNYNYIYYLLGAVAILGIGYLMSREQSEKKVEYRFVPAKPRAGDSVASGSTATGFQAFVPKKRCKNHAVIRTELFLKASNK